MEPWSRAQNIKSMDGVLWGASFGGRVMTSGGRHRVGPTSYPPIGRVQRVEPVEHANWGRREQGMIHEELIVAQDHRVVYIYIYMSKHWRGRKPFHPSLFPSTPAEKVALG